MKKYIAISTMVILGIITGCSKFPDIGEGYKLTYNGRGDIGIVNSQNSYLIYGHILDYAFDSKYILVVERPRDSVLECKGAILRMTKKKCDEAFEKSTFHQYWIVNKNEKSEFNEVTKIYSNVYGPFKRKGIYKNEKN